MKVWIDQTLCTGTGLCEEIVPDVFALLDDGFAYVKENGEVVEGGGESATATIPAELADAVVEAAECCPSGCIFLEDEPPELRLRAAGPDDLELLRRWDEEPHVIASDPNDDWNWEVELGRSPDWREQLVAEVDGRPIGFVQIIDAAREETHYWGDCGPNLRAIDIWIGDAADLGQGHGTRMMGLALARCFDDPRVEAVLLDPLADNEGARRLYERLGFRFVELRWFGADHCAVYRLDRADFRG